MRERVRADQPGEQRASVRTSERLYHGRLLTLGAIVGCMEVFAE